MADRGTHRPILAIVVLFVVFALGLVSGAALFHLGQWSVRHVVHDRPLHHRAPNDAKRGSGPFPPREVLERMADQLELDQAQRRRMREIIATSHERAQAVLDETHDELIAILTDEQREKLDGLSWGRRLPRPPIPPHGAPRKRRHHAPPRAPANDAPPPPSSPDDGESSPRS